MSHQALEILQNARDLLEGARLLRRHRRYPTAVALAVLSLEETAKFIAVNGLFDMAQTSARLHHTVKQRAAVRAIIASMSHVEIVAIMARRGFGEYWIKAADASEKGAKTIEAVTIVHGRVRKVLLPKECVEQATDGTGKIIDAIAQLNHKDFAALVKQGVLIEKSRRDL